METSECFIFEKICACLAVLGNIGKSNPPYIVDLIICPLGNDLLILYVVGRKLFRWTDTAMKFPVHPEPAIAEFSSSFSCVFLCLALNQDCYIHMYFKFHCKLYHLCLLHYVFDHLP